MTRSARFTVFVVAASFATSNLASARQPKPVLAAALRWIDAVRTHQPGVIDPPLLEVSGWEGERLESVRKHLRGALEQTIADPGVRRDVLCRGVLLHTDIAILTPDRAATFTRLAEPAKQGWSSRVQRETPPQATSVMIGVDGQYLGSFDVTAHWPFARMLVQAIPDASSDRFVIGWYRATTARFEIGYRLGLAWPHLQAARKILPGDPWILFYSGAMHEALASPRYQNIARSAPSGHGERNVLGSPREELERAAEYFRRAVAADPSFAEAHLRLGRVLGLLGQHSPALDQVRRALALTDDPVLHYFGELFAGAELEALGQPDAARQAFERAAALFPTAQAPLIAVSELARRFGDRTEALAALERAAALPNDLDERTEPWWIYLRSYAWNADNLLEEVRRPFIRGDSR